jgi:two-component system, chemotaxis family, CheB/CheR fusion protein
VQRLRGRRPSLADFLRRASGRDRRSPFVVVVHLDPKSRSGLSTILAARTRMPVVQVQATERLQANFVYVIAPDRRLHISDQEISAAEFDEPRDHRAAIDLFFRSLAEQQSDGFAIILTGAGQPARSAWERSRKPAESFSCKIRTRPNIRRCRAARSQPELRITSCRCASTKYKRSTVVRRIARRMQVTRTEDLTHYYNLLRDYADEVQGLLGDLLISVTTFFRDSETFEALKAQVIPRLFEAKETIDSIRV